MEFTKQHFSIKDLENLTGIKAHTIRIWEKRYNVLTPHRTSTNIRTYDTSHLKKLLNIAFLNEQGYKISRISRLSEEEINSMVRNINASSGEATRARNALKLATFNFDEALFQETYNKLREQKSFRETFHQIFIPFLDDLGILWQTNTIQPIHEHFITDLIKQKVYLNLSKEKEEQKKRSKKTYVLFLPENEIHDIGILYIYYELLYTGHKAIYLGPSLPLNNLKYLLEINDNLVFISYFTTMPTDISKFMAEFKEELESYKPSELLLFGRKLQKANPASFPFKVKIFSSILDFIKSL